MMKNLIAALVISMTLGCADLSKFSTDSSSLVSSFLPQIDGLLKSGGDLKTRAMAIPTDLPGAADLVTKLTNNNMSLEKLKTDVSGFAPKIDEAVKAGNADLVTSLFDQQKAASTTGLDSAVKSIDSLKGEVVGMEAKAAAKAKEPVAAVVAPVVKAAEVTVFNKTLPGGYVLSGNPFGIESQLVGFIDDAGKAVDKTSWFNFDRLLFKTGSAELDMDKSKAQLTNVSEILKAYPKLKLKVGGYTDNQGKADANMKLSASRAQSVSKALVGMGVKADRLDPEGYGAEHPVCAANDTDDCRAQNRRIAVRVTAK